MSSTGSTVLFEHEDGTGLITLNSPDSGNALDLNMVQGLEAAIDQACSDPSVRVIVLRAAGKAFCVGGNIKAFQQNQNALPAFIDTLLEPLNRAISRLAGCGRPVVSVLNGAVGGGGIGLALCADFVLAASSMKLRGGYSAIGLTPDAGSAWFLSQRIGPIRAKQLFLLNEPYDAQQCLELGIVDAVHPPDELQAGARELAQRLSAGSAPAFARTKSLIDTLGERDFDTHLQLERRYMVESGSEPDAREGIAAFLEKRAPRFQ